MPLLNPTDEAPPEKEPVPVVIEPKSYKGVTVNTTIQPVHSLLTHIAGQAWTVDYYRQVIDKDNELAGQNQTREGAYQQYIRVKNLELRVTNPIAARQNPDNRFEINGESTVYPSVIPNAGDMFIADVGDGREGIFQVIKSTRMSMLKVPTYQIEYVMKGYSDDPIDVSVEDSPTLIADLNTKVIKTVFFEKDYIQHGLNPVLEEEEYYTVKKLTRWYRDMVKDYYRSFYSIDYSTLLPPGQGYPVYDAFLMNALRQMFETRDAPEVKFIRNYNISGDQVMRSQTLWDALLQSEPGIVDYCAQQMGLGNLSTFRSQGMFEGIYFSDVSYVVYPKHPFLSVDDQMKNVLINLPDVSLKNERTRAVSLRLGIPLPALDGLPEIDAVLYKPVTVDDYYIFSKDFYDRTNNMSALEILVWNFLNKKALSVKWLLELCENYRAMGGLERFYYTPIILYLIKATIRSV